jgi:hypothetical protein
LVAGQKSLSSINIPAWSLLNSRIMVVLAGTRTDILCSQIPSLPELCWQAVLNQFTNAFADVRNDRQNWEILNADFEEFRMLKTPLAGYTLAWLA